MRIAEGRALFVAHCARCHGNAASLDELLSDDRLAPDYARGRLGPGPIPGHRAGTELPAASRVALIAFLDTL